MGSENATKEEAWKTSIRRAQNGDKSARDALVSENEGLIYMVLGRIGVREEEKEDLFQVGAIGLIKAIDRFDLSLDYRFSTYAVPLIIGEIRRFQRDDGMLHVARKIRENAIRIARAKEETYQCEHRELTLWELSERTGLCTEEILVAMEATARVQSIEEPLPSSGEEGGLCLGDRIADSKDAALELINRMTVQKLMDTLGEKERRLMELRYFEGRTQMQCAELLGMNQVAVSRLEKKILLFLRQQL